MGFSRHDVDHFYNVLRHVIGRWLSLANSPGFGMTEVFPLRNREVTLGLLESWLEMF